MKLLRLKHKNCLILCVVRNSFLGCGPFHMEVGDGNGDSLGFVIQLIFSMNIWTTRKAAANSILHLRI